MLSGSPANGQNVPDSTQPASTPRLFDFSDLKSIEFSAPPSEAGKALEEARKLGQSSDWCRAIEEASRAIRLSPGYVEAYRFRSETLASKNLYRRAISDLSEVIRIEPGDRMSFILRGWYACNDRDFEHGFVDLETALTLSYTDQDRATVHHWRARCHDLRGEPALALAEYQRAIDLGQDSAGLWCARGVALAQLGEHDRALIDFDRSIALAPSAYAWYCRGESHLARGEFSLAQGDYELAIELDPKDAYCHQGRGWSRLAQGQVDGAIEDFNRSLELAPDWHRALVSRGWAHLAKNDLDRAIADFEKTLRFHEGGTLQASFFFGHCLSVDPTYDHAVDEFYRRCREQREMQSAFISFRGEKARSQYLEFPHFDFYLVSRTRADSTIAPTLIFRVVAYWQTNVLSERGRHAASPDFPGRRLLAD
jgi:tetratricopeptide (TPR) repeat protein